MRIFLLIALLLSGLASPVTAQNEEWNDGCDSDVIAFMQSGQGEFDYGAACDAYTTCQPSEHGFVFCQTVAFETLLKVCEEGDSFCEASAALLAATILAFDSSYSPTGNYFVLYQDEMAEAFPTGIEAFQAGDFDTAFTAFDAIPDSENEGNRPAMIEFILGMIEAVRGNTDEALRRFESVIYLDLDAPIMRYFRAPIYAANGQPELAAIDAEWTRLYVQGNAELEALIAPLVEAYPLEGVESWTFYSIISLGGGVGGSFYFSRLNVEPYPVEILLFDVSGVEMALVNGLSPLPRREDLPFVPLFLLAGSEGSYQITRQEASSDNGFGITMKLIDESLYLYTQGIWYFEGWGDEVGLLAPADAPDPRAGFEQCGVISRLRPGMNARTSYHYEAEERVQFYDAPNGTGEEIFDDVTITGTSECLEETVWWPVQTLSGETGWMPENNGSEYVLNPTHIGEGYYQIASIFICPGAPTPRLVNQRSARVIEGLGANNLRSAPGLDAEIVTQLPEGAEVLVISEPTCADERVWWQVRSGEIEGWTAEGEITAEGATYWLEIVQDW